MRGIITRNKVKGSNVFRNKMMMPYHNPDSQYKVLNQAKIVCII